MTAPEAAASLLLSIAQQQQPPRSNLSFPLSDVKLPAAANLCSRHDPLRINSMLRSGVMPKVNWSRVKTDLKFELGRLLHWKINACFDLVDSSCAGHPVAVDVDCLLLKEQADIHVLHDEHMVHVATFSPEVCSKMHANAAETVNVSVELDEEIIFRNQGCWQLRCNAEVGGSSAHSQFSFF
jgi:hypothetical protein